MKEAVDYQFKEEDVTQMLTEKHRFRKAPYNYAMRKTQLMKERDMALAKYTSIYFLSKAFSYGLKR